MPILVFWNILLTLALLWMTALIFKQTNLIRTLAEIDEQTVVAIDGMLEIADAHQRTFEAQQRQLDDHGDWILDLYETIIETREWLFNTSNATQGAWGEIIDMRVNGP